MINLIPPTAQLQVKREYFIRVASVWLFLLGCTCIAIAILYMPVFVLIQNQLSSFKDAYTQAKASLYPFEVSEKAIADANATAKLLTSLATSTPFTQVIAELEGFAGEYVAIQDFSFVRSEGIISSITITGEATSRLALSQFRTKLENTPAYANAQLPLSNLAKDKEIPFTITIEAEKALDPKAKNP